MLYLFVFFVSVQCVPYVYSELNADAKSSDELSRNTVIDENGPRFPKYADGLVYIPCYIEDGFSEDSLEKILSSFAHYASRTCLRFVPVKSFDLTDSGIQADSPILYLSPILPPKDRQPYLLTEGFFTTSEGRMILPMAINEYDEWSFIGLKRVNQLLIYALGFPPENWRRDRDEYVTVLWNNIQPGQESWFRKQFDYPEFSYYDYYSVSHFHPNDFGEDEKITLISKDPYTPIQRNTKLSLWDVYKIKSLYCSSPE